MTAPNELTLEEMAKLAGEYEADPEGYRMQVHSAVALLTMARELIRLKSALGFLESRTFPLRALVPDVMYQQAYEHGWTDPLPSPPAREEG